jgi:hypothetical protein
MDVIPGLTRDLLRPAVAHEDGSRVKPGMTSVQRTAASTVATSSPYISANSATLRPLAS